MQFKVHAKNPELNSVGVLWTYTSYTALVDGLDFRLRLPDYTVSKDIEFTVPGTGPQTFILNFMVNILPEERGYIAKVDSTITWYFDNFSLVEIP